MTLTKTQCRQLRGIVGKMMTGPSIRINPAVMGATLSTTLKLSLEADIERQYKYWAAMYVMNEINGMLPDHEKVNFSKPA